MSNLGATNAPSIREPSTKHVWESVTYPGIVPPHLTSVAGVQALTSPAPAHTDPLPAHYR